MRPVVVLLLLAACGGRDQIDPGDASPQDLYGTWKIEGTDSEDRPRYLSFYERFDAHPMVEGVRDVHVRAQPGVASHTCPGGDPGSPRCVVTVGGLNEVAPIDQTVTITFP